MPFLEAIQHAASSLSTNPYFSAGFGLIGVGTGMAGLRAVWKGANFYLRKNHVVSVEIPSRDRSYYWVLNWMSTQHAFRTQHLSVETVYHQHENGDVQTQTNFIPNVGDHYFTYRGRIIKMERSREKNVVDMSSGNLWESITLTTWGRDRLIFSDIIEEAKRMALTSEEGRTVVYTSAGGEWRRFGFPRRRRPLHSVILDRGVDAELVRDVKEFLASAPWYLDRGIPYRRGYLLHGPPGCGKSSFITALAGELGLNICVLNLQGKGLTDDTLNTLLVNAPQRSIILLEDIDAAAVQRSGTMQGVSFSGLLNALDGVAASEGRITFMTTNHLERLDPALIRPGRVDVIRKLDHASRHQAEQLFRRFFPEQQELAEQFGAQVPDQTVSMAYLQNYFLSYRNDPKAALARIRDHVKL